MIGIREINGMRDTMILELKRDVESAQLLLRFEKFPARCAKGKVQEPRGAGICNSRRSCIRILHRKKRERGLIPSHENWNAIPLAGVQVFETEHLVVPLNGELQIPH